ncbi:MAG: SGNH/GDSL hydrolase family protein [Rariglobus sp.]
MKSRPLFLLAGLFAGLTASLEAAAIAANDPLVRYVGRFDQSDTAGPRCTWSASTVSFTVSGGSASVKLKDGGKNHWQVVVNGQPTAVLALEAGEQTYAVASNLPVGKHTIELVKRTEANLGATQILGLEIDDSAKLLPTTARPHRIEVIGDSISCGYGNEAANKEEKFTPATENAWLAYGAVAARAVNADYVCIAWSGKKLWPDNSIVSLYDQVAPSASKAKWDFAQWTPDIVVINLGTNDFNAKENPEEAGWVDAYVKFIKRIQSNYPKATIYCTVGTMISEWPGARKPRSTILGYLNKVIEQTNVAGSPPVRLVDFGVQAQHHGIGAQWHPSVKTHSIMADKLVAAIKQDFAW